MALCSPKPQASGEKAVLLRQTQRAMRTLCPGRELTAAPSLHLALNPGDNFHVPNAYKKHVGLPCFQVFLSRGVRFMHIEQKTLGQKQP